MGNEVYAMERWIFGDGAGGGGRAAAHLPADEHPQWGLRCLRRAVALPDERTWQVWPSSRGGGAAEGRSTSSVPGTPRSVVSVASSRRGGSARGDAVDRQQQQQQQLAAAAESSSGGGARAKNRSWRVS